MANRALAAKFARSKLEAREFVHREMTKSVYLDARPDIPAYDESMVRRYPTVKPAKTTMHVFINGKLAARGIINKR